MAVVLFVILTLPLEFTKIFFPARELELTRIGMMLGIAMLAVPLVRRRWRPIPRWLLLGTVTVLTVNALSLAMFRWPLGLKDFATLTAYTLFALFVAQTVRSWVDLRWSALAWAISGVFVAVVAISQQVLGFYLWLGEELSEVGRRNSTFGDPNVTARFLGMTVLVAMALALVARGRRDRWSLAGLGALLGVALVFTLSRWGWMITAVALLTVLLAAPKRRPLVAMAGAFVLAFALTVALYPAAVDRASEVMTGAIDAISSVLDPGAGQTSNGDLRPDLSVLLPARSTVVDPFIGWLPIDEVRRYLIRAGTAMFQDHPMFGVGVGGFQPMILGPYRNYVPPSREAYPTSLPHTDMVRIAAETGVLGLLAVFVFVVGVVVIIRRLGRQKGLLGTAAAIGIGGPVFVIVLASQAAGRFYSEPYLWLLLGLLGGLMGGIGERTASGFDAAAPQRSRSGAQDGPS